jgi:hypothetical protein
MLLNQILQIIYILGVISNHFNVAKSHGYETNLTEDTFCFLLKTTTSHIIS